MAETKLGIIAGGGPLPGSIAKACQEAGREIFIIAFEGETDVVTCDGVPHKWLKLGEVGALLRSLKAASCKEVVLAGPIKRPSLSKLKLDLRGVRFMGKIAGAMGRGDDVMLSAVVSELEGEGFKVIGADDVLKGLCAPLGVMGRVAPDDDAKNDITIGVRTARALGEHDVGQAVIVQAGLVLGVEAAEGTDHLIERCKSLQQDRVGGVLVKVKKPGQERRTDLPTIGPNTIEKIANAGLHGIAVEAGETLILQRDTVIKRADEAGVFVVGVSLSDA